ncbi:MAG: hypothetical protein IKC56_00385 [Clostridia bacterium]|nr:hypothetical protein [Clostridia bacterium]
MSKVDLWGNISSQNNTEVVLELLKAQAELLAEKTNKIVRARFVEIHYSYQPSDYEKKLYGLDSLAHTLDLISTHLPQSGKKVEVDDTAELEDATKLYEKKDYKFEIVSNKYKYRLFTLHYRSAFPLELDVEFGILEDKRITVKVSSIEETENKIRDILTSNKVQFIISKMMSTTANEG